MRARLQSNVERVTSARLRRGQPLAAAIGASLSQTSAGAPLVCLAAMSLAIGFSSPVEAGSTFTVNTALDPGPVGTLSLRQAIASASASDGNTVQFDPSLAGSAITLASGEIAISKQMYVVGLGVGKTTISGNDAYPIFGVACSGATVDIEHMRLTHGKSTLGGAIQASKCNLNLVDVDVTASQATFQGGGVYASQANVSITASSITGNSAESGGGVGGYLSVIRIYYSTISGNKATYQGAGIYVFGSSYARVFSSTISGNSIPPPPGPYVISLGGGGAMIHGSRLSAVNSTIAYNYAFAGGGGIRFYDSYSSTNAVIVSATIANNSTCCYDAGNGILSTGGTTRFYSAIVANNFNRGGLDDLGGSFKAYESLVRSPGTATITGTGSIFGVDPKLGKLGVNGGPTLTMLPAADSQALDHYDCAQIGFNFDQRGVNRCVNGHVDMGAVERQVPEVIIFRNGFDPGG